MYGIKTSVDMGLDRKFEHITTRVSATFSQSLIVNLAKFFSLSRYSMQLPQLGVRAEALRHAPYVLDAECMVTLVSGKPMSDVDAFVANVVAKRGGYFLWPFRFSTAWLTFH